MNQLFIKGVQIEWEKINEYSYLREIPALQFEENLKFSQSITFLWEKMVPENQRYWKQ